MVSSASKQIDKNHKNKIVLRIPGSTANLGPGFDALGLALGIYTKLSFRLLDTNDANVPLIETIGDLAGKLPLDKSNLIYQVMAKQWQHEPELLDRLAITIESQIPLAAGLGSSAAAILGTVWAAQALTGIKPEKAAVVGDALAYEGHPDNLAASAFGGLIVSSVGKEARVATQKICWPDKWATLVVVPDHKLNTIDARAVLPKQISLPDAIFNIQQVGLLVAAVANADDDAFKYALDDKLHEPYRQSLVPELPELKLLLAHAPILGCVLSGAGPSVLVLVNKEKKNEVLATLNKWAIAKQENAKVLDLEIDNEGITEVSQ